MNGVSDMQRAGQLAGRRVLILGGTSGFGLEIARLAAAEGAYLTLIGRDGEKALAVAEEFRGRGVTVAASGLDATDGAALADFVKQIEPVDHVVSMIGGAMGGGFLEAAPETIREAIEGKFFANLSIARAIASILPAGGSLTFTAGAGGRPDNASGAVVGNEAIASLVRGLAVELSPGVRVNAVAPTWTPTPLWRDMREAEVEKIRMRFAEQIPLKRVADPREVAAAYLFLMTCGFITGQTITVDGGLTLVT